MANETTGGLCAVTVQPAGEDPQPCGLELPCPRHDEHDLAWRDLDEREQRIWAGRSTRPSGLEIWGDH